MIFFMMQIDTMTEVNVILEKGGTILFPTDTIWGVGCDACNAKAVDKIYKLKQRDPSKPFILLADSVEMIKKYVKQVHPRIDTLLIHHVRPLTVIYDDAQNLPDNVIAQDGSVAFRVPQDSFCRALIQSYGRPLVATSANVSGQPFPSKFGSISSDIIQGVDYVVKNARKEEIDSEPSVIVRLDKRGELDFIRE